MNYIERRDFMKKILSLILALVLVSYCFIISVSAEVIDYHNYKDFVYVIEDNEDIEIVNYKGDKKKITIPAKINDLTVSEIYGLKDAENLKKIKIPATVDYLRLSKAPVLKKVIVDENSKYFSVENKLVLNKKGTTVKTCPGGLKKANVPDTVTKIYHQAFAGAKIKVVYLGENVEKIGTYAFSKCKKLAKVVISSESKAPKIGAMAFESVENVSFYVKNKTVADQLKKNLKKSKGLVGADIYIGDQLVYNNITAL